MKFWAPIISSVDKLQQSTYVVTHDAAVLIGVTLKQDNVQVNTESVLCITIAYSEGRITEISEQLCRVDQSG